MKLGSFREIKTKAENLTEQGNEAKQQVQTCRARVASCSSRVDDARRQLAAASETDENGNPRGDVAQARAALHVAENMLEDSQSELAEAESHAERVRQAQTEHVRAMDSHTRAERSNLEKIRRLQSMTFGENADELAQGIAERTNELEDARVELLRSMGIEATPEYVSAGGGGSSWGGFGGFAGGRSEGGYGGSEGLPTGGSAAAPVGGGLRSDLAGNASAVPGDGQGMRSAMAGAGVVERSTQIMNSIMTGEGSTPASEGPASQTYAKRMEDAFRNWWMNNFDAESYKNALSEKLYLQNMSTYRKGVAAVIGEEAANALSLQDLEQLSYVQHTAFVSGCDLTEQEIADLYRNTSDKTGNFVTPRIEQKMDRRLQTQAFSLLTDKPQFTASSWEKSTVEVRKQMLRDLVSELNTVFGTNVSIDIDFTVDESPYACGYYSSETNSIHINGYHLDKDNGYKMVQTTIHEMRHAYQHRAVQSEKRVLVSSKTARLWGWNFQPGHYKSTTRGYTYEEYVSQPVEWDAKQFSKQYSDLIHATPLYKGSW